MQDRIRLSIEQDLQSGALQPGSAIDEQALCARFQTSRTPVREALLLLSAKGMVSILPRVGIYVRQLETRELIAMMEGLAELEGVLARLAAHRIGADLKSQLLAALEQTSQCALVADPMGYEQANARLHDLIYQSSGNAFIVEQTAPARCPLPRQDVRKARATTAVTGRAYGDRGSHPQGERRGSGRGHAQPYFRRRTRLRGHGAQRAADGSHCASPPQTQAGGKVAIKADTCLVPRLLASRQTCSCAARAAGSSAPCPWCCAAARW